ncbi:MAG: hypothetical protein RJB66_769 [Pseudomonadota bacterium]
MSDIQFGVVKPQLKFYRSNKGILAGVCKGLAETFGVKPIVMRFLLVAMVLLYGFGLGLYITLAISLPRQDRLEEAFNRRLLGVCGTISKKMKWEVGLVRTAAVLLALGSLGFAVLAYIVLYFSFEEQPTN